MRWLNVRRSLAAASLAVLAGAPAHGADFGAQVQDQLRRQSRRLFGVRGVLRAPASAADYVPREQALARERVKLAGGLKAEYVARNLTSWADQITFWPDDMAPTHLILCIERARAGTTPGGNEGLNTSVQRVRLSDGVVENILYGMHKCDGIRTTPWGTVLVSEEAGKRGRAYEILDPLGTDGHWVEDRFFGVVREGLDSAQSSQRVVQRPKMGAFSWEGMAVLPTGVVYAGDEMGPVPDGYGGSIFKFIPAVLRDPADGLISDLSQSPLVDGSLWALQVGKGDHGTSNRSGRSSWIGPVDWDDPADLQDVTSRWWAINNEATAFYRPEDLHLDPFFTDRGVRILFNTTGKHNTKNWGETFSLVDVLPEDPNVVGAFLQILIHGHERLNQLDNLAIQPVTGNVYVIEDQQYGEVWACLPDGSDMDVQSDGCIPILSVVDPLAEPSGFIFDGTGRTAYMVVMHGETPAILNDFNSSPLDGLTDDLIRITGFRTRN